MPVQHTLTALTVEELIDWVNQTHSKWRNLILVHPETLALPCDVLDVHTAAGLLQHIVAVELRYAQRLQGTPESPYEAIPTGPIEALHQTHVEAMELLYVLLDQPNFDWEQTIPFQTRSMGMLQATRRTILVHALMHTIRHYAQLATLVRQHGIQPGWGMDYLYMGVTRP